MNATAKPISRMDIRRRHDRAANSVLLEYVGRGLKFHDSIYGFNEGIFFVASIDEMPLPPDLVTLGEELGVDPETTESGRQIRAAAVDVLTAEAMVKTPALLHEYAEPQVKWHVWDQRELERRHVVASARLINLISLCEREMRFRVAILPVPSPPQVSPQVSVVVQPVFNHLRGGDLGLLARAESVRDVLLARVLNTPEEPPEPSAGSLAEIPELTEQQLVSSTRGQLIPRVTAAVATARESELAQRLPAGARRHLAKMVSAVYIVRGAAVPESRTSLREAMRDAERIAAAENVETTVIDWDGEWPVVARRYGDGGRTVYRVEDVLRRSNVEPNAQETA